MTRWQVFGGRYDGVTHTTIGDDQTELTNLTIALNQSKLTVHDIDNAGRQLIITIPNQEHA